MAEFSESDWQRVADQIEGYLRDHPHAADTLEGITKWWLPSLGFEVSELIVKQALDHLSLTSIIKCNSNLNGNKVYSSNKTKAEYQPK